MRFEIVWKLVSSPPSQRWLTYGISARLAHSSTASCACFLVPTKRTVPPPAATSAANCRASSSSACVWSRSMMWIPSRSPQMKRPMRGFHRRVWWPKCRPALSRSGTCVSGTVDAPLFFALRPPGPRGPGLRAEGAAWPGRAPAATGGGRFPCGADCRRPRSPGAGACQRRLEVVRQGRAQVEPLVGERVAEAQAGTVQELPPQPVSPGVPVARIAADGMADRGEVRADLVGAPGLQARLDQRVRLQGLDHSEVGARLAGAAPAHGATLGRAMVAAQRRVDRPLARARPSLHQGEIAAGEPAVADHLGETAVGLVGARDDHQPGGVAVQPVHDARPRRIAAAAEEVAEDVDQSRAVDAGALVDDEAGGLVDDGEPLVDVHEPRLGHGARASPASGSAKTDSTSATAPRVIATSATLKAGHSGGSMKSVTASTRTRSARFPSAPPASRPTATHSPGRAGWRANHTSIAARAAMVITRTKAPPSPRKPKAMPRFDTSTTSMPKITEIRSPGSTAALAAAFAAWSRATTSPASASAAGHPGAGARPGLTRGWRRRPGPGEATAPGSRGSGSGRSPCRARPAAEPRGGRD